MGTFIILSAGTTTTKWPAGRSVVVGQLKCAAPNFWATDKQILASSGPRFQTSPLATTCVIRGIGGGAGGGVGKRQGEGVNEKDLGQKYIHERV